MVDTEKIMEDEYTLMLNQYEKLFGDVEGTISLECTSKRNYVPGDTGEYRITLGSYISGTEVPLIRTHRTEPLLYIYEEECENCQSNTVYSKEKGKFVCPFCEL